MYYNIFQQQCQEKNSLFVKFNYRTFIEYHFFLYIIREIGRFLGKNKKNF